MLQQVTFLTLPNCATLLPQHLSRPQLHTFNSPAAHEDGKLKTLDPALVTGFSSPGMIGKDSKPGDAFWPKQETNSSRIAQNRGKSVDD